MCLAGYSHGSACQSGVGVMRERGAIFCAALLTTAPDWLRSVNFRDRMSAAAGTCRSLPARASDRCASKYLPDEGSQAAT